MTSAKEMFKKLGYEYTEFDTRIRCYKEENQSYINFEKQEKELSIWRYKEIQGHMTLCKTDLNLEEVKAMIKQIEELGWNK